MVWGAVNRRPSLSYYGVGVEQLIDTRGGTSPPTSRAGRATHLRAGQRRASRVTAFVSAVIPPAENVLNRAALRKRIQKIWARAENARLQAELRTASGYARDSPPTAGDP